ncbi:MAG: hypothetical protein JW743_04865 [Deltaproteobacteria bacterium]|nr:hypothetical protein [Deltaproteobacteria bacterium]
MKKLFIVFLCLVLNGCATLPEASRTEDKYRANFVYTSDAQENIPYNGEVIFTVSSILFKTKGSLLWFSSQQFVNLPDAIKQDSLEILTAKGFGVRGPYDSYDVIPFQDKKNIDLLLIPTLELSVILSEQKEELENYWAWQSPTNQTGKAEVSGKITIELREITTRELMWTKTIPVKEFEFSYLVSIPWGTNRAPGKLYDANPVFDGMAKGLEKQYPDLIGTIKELIDPEEMAIIKKQCQELKNKT